MVLDSLIKGIGYFNWYTDSERKTVSRNVYEAKLSALAWFIVQMLLKRQEYVRWEAFDEQIDNDLFAKLDRNIVIFIALN